MQRASRRDHNAAIHGTVSRSGASGTNDRRKPHYHRERCSLARDQGWVAYRPASYLAPHTVKNREIRDRIGAAIKLGCASPRADNLEHCRPGRTGNAVESQWPAALRLGANRGRTGIP